MTSYYVCCFDDNGLIVLATQRAFASREAAESYLRTVAYGREPFIVEYVNEGVSQCSSTG
jgi:hypothetical protein